MPKLEYQAEAEQGGHAMEKKENRPIGVCEEIPLNALRSARSWPGMPVCDCAFLSSTCVWEVTW